VSDETTLEVNPESRDLDDVLLAMDVVDTLRHRERIVARELDAEGRESELIERLKEIYTAQGIDVPERILKDGVKALEEQRFLYNPPKSGLGIRLAKIYVTRDRWLKPLIGGIAALAIGAGVYQFGIVGPAKAKAERTELLLTETLPTKIDAAMGKIKSASDDPEALSLAEAYVASGKEKARSGNKAGAESALKNLDQLLTDVEVAYEVRVVYTGGRSSGVFRVPEDDPFGRNYYLIVEAIDARGQVLEVPVTSEEDQSSKRVKIWAQRVSEPVYDRIADDKRDDQIIQNAAIGSKAAGALSPSYDVETPGGAILTW